MISKKSVLAVLPFIIIILGTIPAVAAIAKPGFFPMHDDLQPMRQLEMVKCFKDLQLPCRWVPDMGYGFGYPLFNYYPPFPYYLGMIFYFLGFSILDTIKILFILSFFVSAFGMYLLAREFWGEIGGVISGLFYVWAPYHAVDVYVRGAMNESWAIAFFPLVLFSLYKLITSGRWYYVLLVALSSSFLAISHLPTLVVFVPGVIVWLMFWFYRNRSLQILKMVGLAYIWSLGLASFFILPVIFELKFVHYESLFIGYFNYLAHFVNLRQLFLSSYWGYGSSEFGPNDEMSFSLGYLHWFLSLVALLVALLVRRRNRELFYLILFFFSWTYIYAFLTHQRSVLIWRLVPILATLQFPWRLLSLSSLSTSFLAGSFFLLTKNLRSKVKINIFLAVLVILLLILFNKRFFTWREFYPQMTDSLKFSGELWRLQQTSGIFDYLPKQIPLPPADPPDGDAKIIEGNGIINSVVKKSNFQEYKVKVLTNNALFQINTFYFPGWKVIVNGQEVKIDPYQDKTTGTMVVNLIKGENVVIVKFSETPIRLVSNFISLFSWLLLLCFSFKIIFTRKLLRLL